MTTKEELVKGYTNIETKQGLSLVRQIPGNYVGSTRTPYGAKNSPALLHLMQEILSNAIDEAYSGFGKLIMVTVHPDCSMTITDQGRGMPCGKDFDKVRRSLTVLGSSGKYDSNSYQHSAGLHGLGAKAVNALSKYIEVYSTRMLDGTHFHVKYHMEKPLVEEMLKKGRKGESGTSVTFLPDDTIFDTIDWNDDAICNTLEQSAYLTPGIRFVFDDERRDSDDKDHKYFHREWFSKNGLADYVDHIAQSSSLIDGMSKPIPFNGTDTVETTLQATGGNKAGEKFDAKIEVQGALIYTEDAGTTVISFVNGEPTINGGPHEVGAKSAVFQAIRDYAQQHKLINKRETLEASDTRDGLILTILVKLPHEILTFNDQSKTILGSPEARLATFHIIYNQLLQWLSDHPKNAKAIVDSIKDTRKARVAAKKEREASRKARKTKKKKAIVSDKLKTASARDPKKKALYLTEGNSASAELTMVRDKRYQAVFPLRGKIENAWRVKAFKALTNKEISTIASVLGAGFGSDFDVKKLQYDKIIISTDADPDGDHIASLLIALFYKFFPGLIQDGHLYRVTAPLYQAELKNKKTGEKKYELAYSEEEHDDYEKRLHHDLNNGYSLVGQEERWKGLGSMNPEQTKRYLADPRYRRLYQIKINNDETARMMINLWMGKQADPRKDMVFDEANFDDVTLD